MRDSVAVAPWGEGALLLDLEERRLHELNASARVVWQTLATVGFEDLVPALQARFDVPAGRLQADVREVLGSFDRAGLLTDGGAQGGTTGDRVREADAAGPLSDTAGGLGPFRAGRGSFVVTVDDPQSAVELDRVLAPLRTDLAVGETPHRLTVATGHDRGPVVDGLVADVNALAVQTSPDCVAFHAGAVAVDGRIVMMPGVSNSGKSTLTAAMIRAGATYLTDEVALLDPCSHQLVPYPKSISLDPGSFALLSDLCPPSTDGFADHRRHKWHVDPRPLADIASPGPIAAIVTPVHRHGAATNIEMLEPREAVDVLLANSFDFAAAGPAGFAALVRLAREVPVGRLVMDDLDQAVDAVVAQLARR
ncbi:MAG: PqqD family peptide modification chaperone [Acidimicrobiales bacterium]